MIAEISYCNSMIIERTHNSGSKYLKPMLKKSSHNHNNNQTNPKPQPNPKNKPTTNPIKIYTHKKTHNNNQTKTAKRAKASQVKKQDKNSAACLENVHYVIFNANFVASLNL
jgi:hypothetical protein